MKILFTAAALVMFAAPALAGPGPFGGMSEAGRRTMLAAMAPGGDADRADHERVRAARDRMLTIVGADRLDTAALRRAMDDEREAAGAMRARRQGAMLTAVQSLSVADRKAFVADARSMRGRFEGRIGKWRERRMGRGGPDDGMPPPPM